jgi:hypothetical protein
MGMTTMRDTSSGTRYSRKFIAVYHEDLGVCLGEYIGSEQAGQAAAEYNCAANDRFSHRAPFFHCEPGTGGLVSQGGLNFEPLRPVIDNVDYVLAETVGKAGFVVIGSHNYMHLKAFRALYHLKHELAAGLIPGVEFRRE